MRREFDYTYPSNEPNEWDGGENVTTIPAVLKKTRDFALIKRLVKDFKKNKLIYLMALPCILYFVIYHYWPMYGATIAFKEFSPRLGILDSPWVGIKYFKSFFESIYFVRILKNTLILNFLNIIFGFPAPILFALLMNELSGNRFKRTVQTVTYLPHFISTVIICGMLIDFSSKSGLFNNIITLFGGQASSLLLNPSYFRPIYIGSGIWQEVGWGSIIYLSALTSIDEELYSAAHIDGAGRFKQLIHITLPGILPTIIIMLILRMGSIMNVGFEKVMLLYNPATYEVADVISTFVYRKGIEEANYSYSAAVGLFNSVVNFLMIITANYISRKTNESSLW